MATRIVWTLEAKNARRAIMEYYRNRNGNDRYSLTLTKNFNRILELISQQELLGHKTVEESVRCINIQEYSLFYKIQETTLYVYPSGTIGETRTKDRIKNQIRNVVGTALP